MSCQVLNLKLLINIEKAVKSQKIQFNSSYCLTKLEQFRFTLAFKHRTKTYGFAEKYLPQLFFRRTRFHAIFNRNCYIYLFN